jgi:GNAT superfamily N-acetyltransferase
MGMVPEPVRTQALHLVSALPSGSGMRRVDGDYCFALLHRLPFAQMIEPRPGLGQADVDAAIAEARTLVADHGRDDLVWLTGPDHPWLGDALSRRGLRNEDTVGFESIENAMALLDQPSWTDTKDVEVMPVTSLDAFVAGSEVNMTAFGASRQDRARFEAELEDRWAEYDGSNSPFRRWNALVDGKVVGTAGGVFGAAGINMVGGCVLPEARRQGVYRALVHARWNAAVECGTPALTVQAGRMSRPILERLGFVLIDLIATYAYRVDR